MALTLAQQKQIVQATLATFNGAIGSVYMNDAAAYIMNGGTILGYVQSLTTTDAFKSSSFYPLFLTNEQFADRFASNMLGGSVSTAAMAEAKAYLAGQLNSGKSRAEVIVMAADFLGSVSATDAMFGAAGVQFRNKVEVASYYTLDLGGSATDIVTLQSVTASVTADAASVAAAKEALTTGGSITGVALTTRADYLTAALFDAKPEYTPGGDDLVNTLQDEDRLTGKGDNATLNVTLGTANDASEGYVSPVLTNIKTVNVGITTGGGGFSGINFQDATGVKVLNVERITADTGAGFYDMAAETSTISIKNATRGGGVELGFREESLKGDADAVSLTLDNVRLSGIAIGEMGDSSEDTGNGHESVSVTVKTVSDVDYFWIGSNAEDEEDEADEVQQSVTITANAKFEVNQLDIEGVDKLTIVANADVTIEEDAKGDLDGDDGIDSPELQSVTISGAGDVIIDALGGDVGDVADDNGLTVDAGAMTGDLTLGVEGGSSGDDDLSVTSGSGNDTIKAYGALGGDVSTGAGTDGVTADGMAGTASVTTGAGDDKATVGGMGATGDAETKGNSSFGEAQAASVSTGDGDDTVTAGALASAMDWNNGPSLTNQNDDTWYMKGASIDTGAGKDTVKFSSVAEGASVSTGEGDDTASVTLSAQGSVLAADDTTKNLTTKAFNEVGLNGAADLLGGVVDLGEGDDAATFTEVDTLDAAGPAETSLAANTIVSADAELRGGAGADVVNVKALDAVTVTSASTKTDSNANITGVETLNLTVLNQIDEDTLDGSNKNLAVNKSANDDNDADGAITVDVQRVDSTLATINLVSEENYLQTNVATENYVAGTATAFTLNNLRADVAVNLTAQDATGVAASKVKDDTTTDVTLNLNPALANASGTADTFTLNVLAGSGSFDLAINAGASANELAWTAADSKTDDNDLMIENLVIALADGKSHAIDFNGFGDGLHTEAVEEGSSQVKTSIAVTGSADGTTLTLTDMTADNISVAGDADVRMTITSENNYTITTGGGDDIINMTGDDVREDNKTDNTATVKGDAVDEADRIDAGAGVDRLVVDGNDDLGVVATVNDDVFKYLRGIEELEINSAAGGDANEVVLDEEAQLTGLTKIYVTGEAQQDTALTIGEGFNNSLTIDTTALDGSYDDAIPGGMNLTIDSQDVSGKDAALVNIDVLMTGETGNGLHFVNTGDTKASVTLTTTVADNAGPNFSIAKDDGVASFWNQVDLQVDAGAIDKITLLDVEAEDDGADDNNFIDITIDGKWAPLTTQTLTIDASDIADDDAALGEGWDNPGTADEVETEESTVVTPVLDDYGDGNNSLIDVASVAYLVAGIQGGDTGGMTVNSSDTTKMKLVIEGTANDDVIQTGQNADTVNGGDGDDVIVGDLDIQPQITTFTIASDGAGDSFTVSLNSEKYTAGSVAGLVALINGGTSDDGSDSNNKSLVAADLGGGVLEVTGVAAGTAFTYSTDETNFAGEKQVTTVGSIGAGGADAVDTVTINGTAFTGATAGALVTAINGNATVAVVATESAGNLVLTAKAVGVAFGVTTSADPIALLTTAAAQPGTDDQTFVADLAQVGITAGGADTLNGGAGHDILAGVHGADKINGGDGNDVIIGGLGADQLTGGEGSDLFVYSSVDESTGFGNAYDTIADFDTASDVIDLGGFGGFAGFLFLGSFENRTVADTALGVDVARFGVDGVAGGGDDLLEIVWVASEGFLYADVNQSGDIDTGDLVIKLVGVDGADLGDPNFGG